MSFSLLLIIALFIYLLLRIYRSPLSAAAGIMAAFGSVTLILLYGIIYFSADPGRLIMGHVPERGFYHLTGGLYLLCAFTAVRITRSYIKYRRINRL